MRKLDLTGQTFGRLTVLSSFHRAGEPKARWLCKCSCGKTHTPTTLDLRSGRTRSCGCFRREVNSVPDPKHNHREYGIWNGMIQRCYNPNRARFNRYGGRGIRVCDEWRASFERFFADLGPSPSKTHSLERIDNDGHYEPGNVRWATKKEQSRNTRRNVPLTLNGETLLLTEWAKRLGTGHKTLSTRLDLLGWSVEKTLTTPIDRTAGRFTSRTSVSEERNPHQSQSPRQQEPA